MHSSSFSILTRAEGPSNEWKQKKLLFKKMNLVDNTDISRKLALRLDRKLTNGVIFVKKYSPNDCNRAFSRVRFFRAASFDGKEVYFFGISSRIYKKKSIKAILYLYIKFSKEINDYLWCSSLSILRFI